MKNFSLILFTFLLVGCGGDDSKTQAPGAGGPTITGLDANAEYDRLASHAKQSMHLPQAGDSKTWVDYDFYAKVNGIDCYYAETGSFSISNVTPDSFEESGSFSYTKDQYDNSSCPSSPPNTHSNYSNRNLNSNDYIATRLADLKAFFDLRKRAQSEPWIQSIGITSSESATYTIPSGQVLNTQRITIDIVEKNGVKRREVHYFSVDSWFLAEIAWTKSLNGKSPVPFFEVNAYQGH
jgi:hypothetical protein